MQVAVSSSDTGAATVSPATLDFTTTGWDTPQTVTVLGVDDADLGNESITVSLTASSTDTDYEGKTNSVAVAVTDDDIPAVIVSPTTLDIDEGGSATYTVALRSQPSGEVVIEWHSLAHTDLSIDPSLLSFTTVDWETPQTLTVTAGHDTDKLDDSNTITHTATGGGYGGLTVPSVLIRVIDDDKTVPGTPGQPAGIGRQRRGRAELAAPPAMTAATPSPATRSGRTAGTGIPPAAPSPATRSPG